MSERDLVGAVEGVRKVIQDLLAPEVRALVVRVDALEKQFGLQLNASEQRTGTRIDALGERVDARIDALSARMDALERRLDTRIDVLEQNMNRRFDTAQAQVDARFDAAQANVDARFDAAQAQVDARFRAAQAQVDARFDAVDVHFHTIENTIRDNHTQMMAQFAALMNFNVITERLNRLEATVRPHPDEMAHQLQTREPQSQSQGT
jgi:flagellar capping protein FliD